MEERNWQDLETDCLVNVLGRVGMESLLLDVPFVCKSWYKASLSPLCWKRLAFPKFAAEPWFCDTFKDRFVDLYRISKVSDTAFIKFLIDRSCRIATMLLLPNNCTAEALKYAADQCPALEIAGFPIDLCNEHSSIILEAVGKWKNLEWLVLGSSVNLIKILEQISLNCKNFYGLNASTLDIGKEEASAIVDLLPTIKHLILRGAFIDRVDLISILQGCKELVYLDVRDCVGFQADDKILELASHISTFKYEGSRLPDSDDEDWIDYDEVDDDSDFD